MAIREDELSGVAVSPTGKAPEGPPAQSLSIFKKRWRKFRAMKRGYYSFLVVLGAYLLSFILPLLINNKPLVLRYEGAYYFPLLTYTDASEFGEGGFGEPDYRDLKERFAAEGDGNWMVMPFYPTVPTNRCSNSTAYPRMPRREIIPSVRTTVDATSSRDWHTALISRCRSRCW